jgi:predicted nucleic acid-binding protein
MSHRYGISCRDAAIVAAAETLGAKLLYTEDLNDGQRYGSTTVCDPFG